MKIIGDLLLVFVAALHFYIMWLEMFVWTTKAPKIFRKFPRELFEPTKQMAGNQGLYNGFLATGLIWSVCIADPIWHFNVGAFFLSCVAVAGVYGALTVQKSILYVQTIPALIALLFLSLGY